MPNSSSQIPSRPETGRENSKNTERRLTRRVEIRSALIDVELLTEPRRRFPVFGVDLNADGIGLALPADVVVGTPLRLTFVLSADSRFVGVDAEVVHNHALSCGARFRRWNDDDRLRLLEYLDSRRVDEP